MRLKKTQLLFLIPLMLLTQAYACNSTAQKILNKLAVTNQGFERSVVVAHKDGFVSDDQERQFLEGSRKVALTGNEVSAAFMAGDKATALAKIDVALAAIDDLINNGVAGVKNPTTKTEINAGLLALRGLFTTAAGFIQPVGGVK